MQTQKRLLYIIDRLSKETCTTKQLTLEVYDTDEEKKRRIIQHDIKLLREHFDGLLVSPYKGAYKFVQLPSFMQNLKSNDGLELHELLEFMTVFDNKMLTLFEKDEPALIGRLKGEVKSLYKIHENPLEVLRSPFLAEIKRAIKYRLYVNIGYKEQCLEALKLMQVHRIIYAKGNWYIAGYSSTHALYNGYRFMRINFIESFELCSKSFNRDIQVEYFIDNFQSLFSLYQAPTYEVKIHVAKEVMRHFKAKVYLKSQNIVEQRSDGLVISYQVSCNMEIVPLIKQWIPHITVLEPEHLKVQLRDEVERFLENML